MLLSTDNFKKNSQATYKLHMVAFENEFVAIAINNLTKVIEAFDKVGSLSDLSLYDNKFSDINVILVDNQFTLIPESIFNEKNVCDYLNFSTETLDKSEVIITKNAQFELTTIWYLNEEIKQKVTKSWAGCSFHHLIAHKFENINETDTQNSLFIDFFNGNLSVILFTHQELQIANQFKTNGDEDALYYLLLTLEQSKLKPEDLNVKLSGTNSFKTKLDKYFKNVYLNSYSNTCSLNLTEEDKAICSIL